MPNSLSGANSKTMNYDITALKGSINKPAIIFIHGLGMDKSIWESPDEAKVLGGRFPVGLLLCGMPGPHTHDSGNRRLFLGKPPENLTTIFHDLKEQGYTLVAWSQRRPAAEIRIASSELRDVIRIYDEYCKAGIVLIGHSRGGLVARDYLKHGDERVRALITLSTPHRGSRMAQWADYTAPLASVINPLVPGSARGTLTYTIKRVFNFLESKAVKELLPDSNFFRTINDGRVNGVYYSSFGGKDPTFFSVYRRVIEKEQDMIQTVFSVPEVFERLIPERLFPDEMKKGRGDGLVTIESSKFQWADEHHDFEVNHAGILFDNKVREKIMDILKEKIQL